MTLREKAKIAMKTAFEEWTKHFAENGRKLTSSQFKKFTQSSVYTRHQGSKEIERRKKRMEVRLGR